MNNFREMLNSLRDAFMQLPMPTRVIGASMAVLIAIGLWMLTSGVGQTASKVRLFASDNLTDDEITKILAAFSAARLNDWEVEYNRIKVPADARDEYLNAAAEVLPLKDATIQSQVQEDANPFFSDSFRQSRESHAKELDLGRRISAFPDILRASVEHDILSRGFGTNLKQSASVVVTPVGSEPLSAPRIRAIKEMVRASYAGMLADDVVVTDVNARGLGALEEENPLLAARIEHEEWYTKKAMALLQGFGPLTIDATVEIDPTLEVEHAKLAYDQQGVPLQESNSSLSVESSKPVPSGVPGTATNALGNQSAQLDPANTHVSKTTQKNEQISKVTGESWETSKKAAFQPKRVSYSVGVPESYYEKIYRIQYLQENIDVTADDIPPMTPDVRAKLKQDTAARIKQALDPTLLPVAPGEDKFPFVEVWDHRDFPELAAEEPSQVATALSWLANSWQTLGLFVLAIIALIVARSVGKMGAGVARPDFEEGFGLELPKPPEEEIIEMDEDGGPRLTITGQHLKQELSQLVTSNPEAAANVLRKWLDSPSAA